MVWIYKKSFKVMLTLLQMAAAGVLVYCILNIGFWMEDSYSLREMSRSYEESELFFRQVDSVLADKIKGQQNSTLFETDGEPDLEKQIDIQSYGQEGSTVWDMNTTYRLADLIDFCESGAQQAMHDAILDALAGQQESSQEAGEILDKQAAALETISPVTGILLAECSRWYSDPASFVLEVYTKLETVSADIYERYQEYTLYQDESWSSEAPSNLHYCIENSGTGELYTNTDESSYEEAVAAIEDEQTYTSLYEGERSFNIMVTNPDNVMNPEAGEWFMKERFVNTNERVFLAVDTSYPVSDSLHLYAEYFSKREGIVWGSLAGLVCCAVVLLVSFVILLYTAGWSEGRCTPKSHRVDLVPTELAAGVYMIIAVLCLILLISWEKTPDMIFGRERILLSVGAAVADFVLLSACQSFVRRVRMKTLWSNSICRMLVHIWRQVTSARMASGQLLFFYIIFFILNFVFLLLLKPFGIFLVLVLDMAVLLYLLRDMAGKQSIYEGIQQISKGDLSYKIDTSALQGETYEMAKAVNEMGDGLQQAVDAIVKNERLKAELITNVSHDIKTPLTSIVNYVDLLKRENLQGERVQQYIRILDQKSQRLRQLTEDLVEASKISSGNIELQMVQMQMQSMVYQAYGEFQERLEEHGLTAEWEMEKEPVLIMADGRQLWRILENLLGNIYKYALEDTKVYIELKCEEQMACLSLENISREKLMLEADELMGRFVRGDRSRSTEGSGLGLSIAKSLTELQGGTFTVSLDGDLFRVTVCFPIVIKK